MKVKRQKNIKSRTYSFERVNRTQLNYNSKDDENIETTHTTRVIFLVMTAVSGESRWTHWLVQSEWCARHSRVNVQLPVHARARHHASGHQQRDREPRHHLPHPDSAPRVPVGPLRRPTLA